MLLALRLVVLYRYSLHACLGLVEDLRRNTELHPPSVRIRDLDEVARIPVAGLPFHALYGAVCYGILVLVDETDAPMSISA